MEQEKKLSKEFTEFSDWGKSYQIDSKLLSEPLPFKQFVKPERNDNLEIKLQKLNDTIQHLFKAITYINEYANLLKTQSEEKKAKNLNANHQVNIKVAPKVKKKKGVSRPSKDDFKL